MKIACPKYVTVCGIFVIIASLCSGCATASRPDRVPMSTRDLNHFAINCSIKEQQVAMLQSMRQTGDERMVAGFVAMLPWAKWTDPGEYKQNVDVHNGRLNWMINYHLNILATHCP
jgi:hypothetical protein